MKLKMYSVYDKKAQAWTTPIFQVNDEVAQRNIGNAANDPQHNFHMNSEDYSLYCIGEWDDVEGQVTPLKEKKLDVATLVRQPQIPTLNS